jgi:hypothetical protein
VTGWHVPCEGSGPAAPWRSRTSRCDTNWPSSSAPCRGHACGPPAGPSRLSRGAPGREGARRDGSPAESVSCDAAVRVWHGRSSWSNPERGVKTCRLHFPPE